MSWLWAALTPHPPIIVPGVGGGREREAAATLDGVGRLMRGLVSLGRPDRILLLSPHQPYALGAFAVNGSPLIKGGLSMFGAPVSFELRTPASDAKSLADYLGTRDIPVGMVSSGDLSRDQGSTVPLYFLRESFAELPDVVLSSPIGLDLRQAFALGEALADFDDGRSWGLAASGDLSHRLKPGAPAGFRPEGQRFDDAVVKALENADASVLLDMPRKVIEEAGECGLRSVLAMLGMVSRFGGRVEVLSYEGPYGVGYCCAFSALGSAS
ncbi:MAG: hypothetical protein LBR87_03920 [Synergistaceae bacterium]|jgi:aromatic ring-opening dioxygenase LigB subunit|nr:hypothetical protein [Synergistaceae bacterium]